MKTRGLEGEFYEYVYHHGQAEEGWTRNVLEFYAPHFARCQRVLDVGCGRGEFIELLGSQGISAAGIDIDENMVNFCRQKGLPVVRADLFEYLPQHQGEFDGIFCSNLIEHMTVEQALQFVRLAFASLADGGVILMATPNPESLIVHLFEFWRDPTHIRLYNRPLLEFLLISAGFLEVQSGENPRTAWALPAELQEAFRSLPKESTRELPALWQAIRNKEDAGRGSRKKRWIFGLRRQLAQFLARTVMFEEFSAVDTLVDLLQQDMQEVKASLQNLCRGYNGLLKSHTRLLTTPREIFASGRKPG